MVGFITAREVMKRIELTIKALSPLAIGHRKPGSVSEAGDYIPGSTIRGAIASIMLAQSGQQNADLSQHGGDFQRLFLDETAAIFQNAYPTDSKNPTDVKVLPATALSSKTESGFKADNSDNDRNHGVFDTLIDRFCAESHGYPYDPKDPEDSQGRVEPFGGFYSQDNGTYRLHSVSKRLLTRVGINRRRATAQDRLLYSIEVLDEIDRKAKESTTYRGAIWVEDDLADLLVQFINTHTFRVGGGISRGLGKVEIQASEGKVDSTLGDRIDKFNQAIAQRWQLWDRVFNSNSEEFKSDRTYFTLDLQSDAILKENWMRTTVISEDLLREQTGIDDPSLELHVAYSSYDYRSGWNSAWGRMKDIELVTNWGAVYLFSSQNPALWTSALANLEIRGIGDRTPEGFGQVRVCHEFHQILWEDAV